MALSPLNAVNELTAAAKQTIKLAKTATRTSVALVPFSVFDLAGTPGAGTLAGTSTANGVVPSDATAGFPAINAFGLGNTGYLSRVEYYSSVASRLEIYDVLFKSGAYSYAAGTTSLSSQPPFSGRCPDYTGGAIWGNGLEIWLEVSTAFTTGTAWQAQVTYTNEDGTTGRTTIVPTAMAAAALTLGKLLRLGFQAGDCGLQKIESVIVTNGGTAMTAGAFNILVVRKLWGMKVAAGGGDVHDFLKTGGPVVYADSALALFVTADSTSTGLPDLTIDIANA